MQEYMISIVRMICLMISNFGYYNLLRKHTRLCVSYLPAILVGIQVTILFLAGILNILLGVSVFMLCAGVLLFAFDLMHGRASEYKHFSDVSYAYLGICTVILFFRLQGSLLYRFDDFSHWATVTQDIMSRNAYPNYASQMVVFRTYPLGTATYLYYCGLLAGTEEGTLMLLQALIMVYAIMPLFSCIRKHKLCTLVYLLIFTNFILIYNVPVSSLQVDTVLPLFGMGSFLISWNIYTSCRNSEKVREKTDIWAAVPLIIMTLMIKNSGVFFALAAMIVVIFMWKDKLEDRKICACVLLLPAFFMILWIRHCEFIFSDALLSKHTVSVQNYMQEYSAKSSDQIAQIGSQLLHYMIGHPALPVIFFLLLGLILACRLICREKVKRTLWFSLMIVGVYFVYVIGLYGMYVFSMPMVEAEILNEVSRYVATIDIASFYLITAYTLDLFNDINTTPRFAKVFACALAAMLLIWGTLGHWQLVSGMKNPEIRMNYQRRIEEYRIPLGAACIICDSGKNMQRYPITVVRFLLWSPEIYSEELFDEKSVDGLFSFQYIFMNDYDNPVFSQWIQEHYPEQYGNDVIVIN